jgi:hypothetical protein
MTYVSWYRAAPERDVHRELSTRGGLLGAQRGDVDGGRDAVERHVDDRGDAASRCGGGRGREALPVRAARLVDVDVAVHQSG